MVIRGVLAEMDVANRRAVPNDVPLHALDDRPLPGDALDVVHHVSR